MSANRSHQQLFWVLFVVFAVALTGSVLVVPADAGHNPKDPIVHTATVPEADPDAVNITFSEPVATNNSAVLGQAFEINNSETGNNLQVNESVEIKNDTITLTLTDDVLPEDELNASDALSFNPDATNATLHADGDPKQEVSSFTTDIANELDGPAIVEARIPQANRDTLELVFDEEVDIDGNEGDLAEAFSLNGSATENDAVISATKPTVDGQQVTLELTDKVRPEDGNLTGALEFTNAVANATLVSDDEDRIPAEGTAGRTVINNVTGPLIKRAAIPADDAQKLRIEFDTVMVIKGDLTEEELAGAFTLDGAATANKVAVDPDKEVDFNGNRVTLSLTARVLPEDGNLTDALNFTNTDAGGTLVSDDKNAFAAEEATNRTVVNDLTGPHIEHAEIPDDGFEEIRVEFNESVDVDGNEGDLAEAFTLDETATARDVDIDASAEPTVNGKNVSLTLTDRVLPEDGNLTDALGFTNAVANDTLVSDDGDRIPAERVTNQTVVNDREGPTVDEIRVPAGEPRHIVVTFDDEIGIFNTGLDSDSDAAKAFTLNDTAFSSNPAVTDLETENGSVVLELSDDVYPEEEPEHALSFTNGDATNSTISSPPPTRVPAEGFDNRSIENELDGPVVERAVVRDGDPTSITVEFDRELDVDGNATGVAAAFSLDDGATTTGADIATTDSATVNGSRVTLNLTEPALPGDELNDSLDLDATAAGVALVDNTTGVPAERFSNLTIDNELDGPEFDQAVVSEDDPDRLVVEFDANLTVGGKTDDLGSAFELDAVDTTARVVDESASLHDSDSVALNLSAEIEPGDELVESLSFDPANASDLLRAAADGTPAEGFDRKTVENNLPEPNTGTGGGDGGDGGGDGGDFGDADSGDDVTGPTTPTPSTTTSEPRIRDRIDIPDDATPERLQWVDTRTQANKTVAEFEDPLFMREIRFSEPVEQTVQVAEMAELSAATSAIPGTPVETGWVNLSTGLENTSATVVVQLDEDRVSERGLEPEQLRVLRFDESEQRWQPRDTRVLNQNETIVLEADTPGFSPLAVSGVRDPVPEIDVSPEPATADEAFSVDGTGSTGRAGDIVAYEWVIAGEQFTGDTVTTVIEEPGRYPITLTVRNEGGETNTTTVYLTVDEPATDSGADSVSPSVEPAQLDVFVTLSEVMTVIPRIILVPGMILTVAILIIGKWLRIQIEEYETVRVVLTDSVIPIRIRTGDDDRMERL